jgi:hypothetical protein
MGPASQAISPRHPMSLGHIPSYVSQASRLRYQTYDHRSTHVPAQLALDNQPIRESTVKLQRLVARAPITKTSERQLKTHLVTIGLTGDFCPLRPIPDPRERPLCGGHFRTINDGSWPIPAVHNP